jgi:hypothetical protein
MTYFLNPDADASRPEVFSNFSVVRFTWPIPNIVGNWRSEVLAYYADFGSYT